MQLREAQSITADCTRPERTQSVLVFSYALKRKLIEILWTTDSWLLPDFLTKSVSQRIRADAILDFVLASNKGIKKSW